MDIEHLDRSVALGRRLPTSLSRWSLHAPLCWATCLALCAVAGVGTVVMAPATAWAQPADAKKPPAADAAGKDAKEEKKAAEGDDKKQPDGAADEAGSKEGSEEGEGQTAPADDDDDAPLMGQPPPAPAPPTGQPKPKPGKVAAGSAQAGGQGASGEVTKKGGATEGEEPKERTKPSDLAGPSSEVYAEDWWKLSRPMFELHGYYRVRSEFFHNMHLGRMDTTKPLWPRPAADDYVDTSGARQAVVLCGDDPRNPERCRTNTQAGANMRFRLEPELHVSDNVRVRAQIDMLDNIVLGSTPEGYNNRPADGGGYSVVERGGFSPIGSFASTVWAPQAGNNSTKDSILVKRVWGEYSSPIGQLRFGRMPSHWGLGMFVNAGDGHDSDWQSTADRLMFITGVKSWDLYFAAAWDFANEGATSAVLNEQQGQPYDLTQKDDVDQWVFVVVRRMNEQLAKKALHDGEPVFNGGSYVVYRQQSLANDTTDTGSGASLGQNPDNLRDGYLRRGAWAVIPDFWLQFMYDTFRLEVEAVLLWGEIENVSPQNGNDYVNQREPNNDGWHIRQFGIAGEMDYKAIEDRLKVGFNAGFATGDSDVDDIKPPAEGLQPQLTLDRTFSTMRFHPDYRIDLILWRQIMTRVQGAYYFKPSVSYDFIRDPDGQKIGGGAAVIWSRASEFVQAPGHAHDLGVEINLKIYYQAKDGVLNDDPDKMGGFYTAIEYGVLFPLDGLGYLPGQIQEYNGYQDIDGELSKKTAQTVRWYLGIMF